MQCHGKHRVDLNVVSGIPNTLPPQDLKGALSLAASEFAPVFTARIRRKIQTWRAKTLVPATRRKTGIYNIVP
jgi:hypothetical protein